MKTKSIIISLVAFVVAIALASGCSHRRFGHEGFAENMLEHIDDHVDDLDLNEEQEKKYQEIRVNMEAALSKQGASHKEFMVVLHEKINRENPDISTINGLLKERLNEMPKGLAVYLDYFEEFYNTLNEEQKAELLADFRKKMNRRCF